MLPQLAPASVDSSLAEPLSSSEPLAQAQPRRCRPQQAIWALTLEDAGWPQRWDGQQPSLASFDAAYSSELSTDDCLALVEQLANLGIEDVTLAGGDGYWRHDWPQIVHAIRARDMSCTMTSGGRGFHAGRAQAVASAGVQSVSIALDGLGPTHDQRRGTPGAFQVGLHALTNLRAAGVPVAVHTQLRAGDGAELATLFETIVAHGAHRWQLELADDQDAARTHPEHAAVSDTALPALLSELARRCAEAGMRLSRGRQLDARLCSLARPGSHFDGADAAPARCVAHRGSLAIGADGAVTGCPAWPRESWPCGSLHHSSLDQLWRATPACQS